MRVLGIDFGQRRIGLAISDALGITAQPLAVMERSVQTEDIRKITSLVREHAIERIVIGLPLGLDGKKGPQAQRALAFGRALGNDTHLTVEWMDERFTTAQGSRALREAGQKAHEQKSRIDQVAAQLILQSFLDMKNGNR